MKILDWNFRRTLKDGSTFQPSWFDIFGYSVYYHGYGYRLFLFWHRYNRDDLFPYPQTSKGV